MARADVGRTPVHELGAREPVLALLVALLEELCHHERRPLHLEQGRPEPRLFSKEAGNVEETTRLFLRSRYSNGRVRINLPVLPHFEISARNDKSHKTTISQKIALQKG